MKAQTSCIPVESLTREFGAMAERWAGLGVWSTLWNQTAQLVSPIPQNAAFWKHLWNHGQGFRNELTCLVRRCLKNETVTSALHGVDGLRIRCTPLNEGGALWVVVACYIDADCDWDENFARLCSKWKLDAQLLRRQGQRQERLTRAQVEQAVSLIELNFRTLAQFSELHLEADQMTAQLSDAYEELSLIYRVGSSMRVTQQPQEHFRQLFDDLEKTTSFMTMAAVLYDTDVLDPENRLIIGGEAIVDAPEVLKIADTLDVIGEPAQRALIINNLSDYPQLHWAGSWLERLIAIPVICNQTVLGMILVFNQSGNQDFNSTDLRLLHSVIDRSAVYLENVLLYGDLNKLLMGLLHALVSSIDAKDPYTCGHSTRVALISKRIAEKVGADQDRAERVYLSGLLHDVGKIGISELILCKPGRLTADEMYEMKKHPEIGAKILRSIKQLDDIIPGVLYHHEWLNGTGYPQGLSSSSIPWIAKIVGLADAFDAMTSGRNYRDALPLQAAMAEIRRFAGTQFCPELADALIALVQEGLTAELSNIKKTSAFDNVYTKWNRLGERDEH